MAFSGHSGSVASSLDGTLIAFSAFMFDEGEVRIHQRRDGKLVRALKPRGAMGQDFVYGSAVSFSRDGAWLAAGAGGELGGGLNLFRTSTWTATPPSRGPISAWRSPRPRIACCSAGPIGSLGCCVTSPPTAQNLTFGPERLRKLKFRRILPGRPPS